MQTGIERIKTERERQIKEEKYTAENDDQYTVGELATAAICYLAGDKVATRLLWPWWKNSYKRTPDDRIKELTKAGALVAAEIDRLERLYTKREEFLMTPWQCSTIDDGFFNVSADKSCPTCGGRGVLLLDGKWSNCPDCYTERNKETR